MNTEEKVQFLGEELAREVQRVNELIPLIKALYEDIGKLLGKDDTVTFNENRFTNTRNEVTYLHNRVNEIEKLLGMGGSVPGIKPSNRIKYK